MKGNRLKSRDRYLEEAFLFYRATRYDLHGKAILKTNPKEYIVDTDFRTWMAGYRVTDTGRLFENAVYLQLFYEGWSVHVGKFYGKEVDFVPPLGDRRAAPVHHRKACRRTERHPLGSLLRLGLTVGE